MTNFKDNLQETKTIIKKYSSCDKLNILLTKIKFRM